ncbi:hypothetical protein BH09SUM1_BH09SUM1_09440 [soil metagenome]
MKDLSPQELQNLLFAQGRRIAALEERLRKLEPHRVEDDVPPVPMVMAAPEPAPDSIAPIAAVVAGPPPHPTPAAAGPVYAKVISETWEPKPHSIPELLKRREEVGEPEGVVHGSGLPFMTEAEFKAPAPAQPVQPPTREQSFEQAIGSNWLVRIGGVLLVIGAALGAMVIQPHLTPALRVICATLFAGALGGVGVFLRARSETLSRALIAIAIALAYFIAFSAHYIPPTRIFQGALPSLVLMVIIAAGLVVIAERWFSQFIAGFGFALAVLAALMSAQETSSFALVALGLVAVASGVLLVRNEWTELTALALVGTYGSMAALWMIMGPGAIGEGMFAHLGALLLYHAVFTAAFMKWSRPWMAREMMADRTPLEEGVPAMPSAMLPYSTAFPIINSIGLIALSISLLWITKTEWPHVHYLLFSLAALELGKVALPQFRRGNLASFHVVLAMGLVTGGLVSAFGGMMESAALALQALMLVIAGTRARSLRFLRVLASIPAFLVLHGYSVSGIATFSALLSALVPPVLILLTALPWESMWVRAKPAYSSTPLDILEGLSAQARSLLAVLMCCAALKEYVADDAMMAPVLAGLSVLLLAGILIVSANGWLTGALVVSLIGQGAFFFMQGSATLPAVIATMGLAVVQLVLWNEALRQLRSIPGRALLLFATAGFALLVAVNAHWTIAQNALPYSAIVAAIFAAVVAAAGELVHRGRLNFSLISLPRDETVRAEHQLMSEVLPSRITAALLIPVMAELAILRDAPISPISPALASLALLAGWFTRRDQDEKPVAPAALLISGGIIGPAGLFVYTQGALWAALPSLALAATCLFISNMRKLRMAQSISLTLIGGIGIAATGLSWQDINANTFEALCGLGAAVFMLACGCAHITLSRKDRSSSLSGDIASQGLGAVIAAVATVLAMALLGKEGLLLSGTFITVSWGVVGLVLLFCGFVFLHRGMRILSMTVFGVTVARVFFFDLAHSDSITRVVAFIGVGILLIVAGVAYGVLAKRLLREEEPSSPGAPPPS